MRVIGLAMHQVKKLIVRCPMVINGHVQCIIDEQEEKDRQAASDCHHPTVPLVDLPVIHARLINFSPMIRLKDVKAQAYGNLSLFFN
jgi:hypothetical protein